MNTAEIIAEMQANPALAEELRAVLLTRELLHLPEAVDRLAAAQVRTEARLEELAASVDRLAAAQARTDAAVGELRREVGQLSQILGGTIEEDGAAMVRYALEHRGYSFVREPTAVDLNGELDVIAVVREGAGQEVSVLVESKVRLRPNDVRRFAGRCQRLAAEAGLPGPLLVYVYGLRIYEGSQDAAVELGLGVLNYRGEQVSPELCQAAS